MSYRSKQDSIQKIAARAAFYASVPRSALYSGKHIVIPSIDCGDIKLLVNDVGVSPNLIIATDTDSAACRAALKLGVETHCQDIRTTLLEEFCPADDEYTWNDGEHIASINLDLCGTLIGNEFEVLLSAVESIPLAWQGSLSYTYSRAHVDKKLGLNSSEERAKYLHNQLKRVGWNKSASDILRDSIDYQSWSYNSRGAPMTMVNFSIGDKTMKKLSKKAQAKAWSEAGKKAWKTRRKNAAKKK